MDRKVNGWVGDDKTKELSGDDKTKELSDPLSVWVASALHAVHNVTAHMIMVAAAASSSALHASGQEED